MRLVPVYTAQTPSHTKNRTGVEGVRKELLLLSYFFLMRLPTVRPDTFRRAASSARMARAPQWGVLSGERLRSGLDETGVEHTARPESARGGPGISEERHDVVARDIRQNGQKSWNERGGEDVVGRPECSRTTTTGRRHALVQPKHGANILPVGLSAFARLPTRPDAQADLVSHPIQSKIQCRVTLRELHILVKLCQEHLVGRHHETGLALDHNLPHERRCP